MTTTNLTAASKPAAPGATNGAAWRLGGTGTRARLDASVLRGHALRASFTDVTGRLVLEGDGTPVSVEVRIGSASVDTGDARRDWHLRSSGFLDVERHPYVCFRSRWLEPAGTGRWRVHGDLHVREVTRPVVVDVTYDRDDCQAIVKVHGRVDRRDFGLVLNRIMERTFRVDTELTLQAEVPAVGCGDKPVASPCTAPSTATAAAPALAA